MFAVESYAAVSTEAAKVLGLSRKIVSKMCRYSAPPAMYAARNRAVPAKASRERDLTLLLQDQRYWTSMLHAVRSATTRTGRVERSDIVKELRAGKEPEADGVALCAGCVCTAIARELVGFM
jgi:hypothetical protein